ncbi:MAG: response regulator [Arcobacteraceae bacterium]|nr:response regulator [Arcobacteraceae bacterium]MDY0328168.1 response regulator [Arcobacteraceae bacterium]
MNHDSFNINKDLLSKAVILYVEDEDLARQETSELLQVFFDKVFIATNGQEAFEIFKTNSDKIDVVLTDINMPIMNGVDLISNIRETNWDIPILVNTGFDDSKTILKVIKLNIANYILKPIQINTTLKIISRILEESDKTKEIIRQRNELNQIMSILDSQNLICEYDINGNITYANDIFCLISEYKLHEVLGKRFDYLRHQHINQSIYDKIWTSLQNGQTFSGRLKKITKNKKPFYVHSTIFPIFDKDKKIFKFRSFCSLRTEDEEEKNSMKKQIISLKSDFFKKQLHNKELKSQTTIDQGTLDYKTELEIISLEQKIEEYRIENEYLHQKLDALQIRVEEYQYQLFNKKSIETSSDIK